MNGTFRHVIISIAFLSLIISAFASSGVAAATVTDMTDGPSSAVKDYTPSSVIRINGDDDIATYATSGDGTPEDPFVIEGLEINATGQGAGIFVCNVTDHLIIRDCLVYDAVYVEDDWGPGVNIFIRSTTNCVLENNTCIDASSFGIWLYGADGNVVSNNTVSLGYEGIYLYGSSDNLVTGNHISEPGSTGIEASGASEYNVIDENDITDTNYGIYLYAQGNHNIVQDNTITGVIHGIYLNYANNNSITSNLMEVTGYGLWLEGTSCDNSLVDNICMGGSRGVYMNSGYAAHISNINVTENQFLGAYMGVHIYSTCTDIAIVDNYVEDSRYFGVLIDEGVTNTVVTGNAIINSTSYGIYVMAASYSAQIYGNALYDNFDSSHTQAWDGGAVGNNAWNTSTYGNYYNEHIGPDADQDGIVDTVYTIDCSAGGTNNVDHYPLASVLNITSPANNSIINDTSFVLTGTLIDYRGALGLSYWNQHTSIIEDIFMVKEWSMRISLVLGVNDITLYGVDYDGRELFANITITCTAPNIVTSPTSGTTTYTNVSSFGFSIHVYGHTTLSTLSIVATHLGGEFYTPWSYGMTGTDYYRTESWTLYQGTTVFRISASDADGCVSTVNLTVVLDSVLPVVNITSPSDGSYSPMNDVNVTWTASDNYELDKVEYSLDHTSWNETEEDRLELIDLPNGNTTVWVRATDMTGNTATDSVTFYVDTVWPSLSISGPSDGSWILVDDVTIYWNATDALSGIASIAVSNDAGNWYDATGRTNYTFYDLSDGYWAAYVRVTDRAGLTTNCAVSFHVDADGPLVTITSHADGGYYTGSNVSWTATDHSGVVKTEVSTNGTDWTVITGTYHDFDLPDGEHTIYLRLTDNVGHNTTVDITFTVDNVQPEVNITTPSENDVRASGFTVTWTAEDALSGIDHYAIKVDDGSWTNVSGNSTTVSGLGNGTHAIYVRAYDRSGNVAEDVVNVTVDAVAPVVTITSPVSDSRMNSSDITVSWTILEANGIDILEIKVDDGGWRTLSDNDLSEIVEDLSEGSHTIYVRATDMVGNNATDAVTIVIDLTAPTVTVSPIGNDVDLDTAIVVEFSESMDHAVTSITVSGVSGSVTWNGTKATFEHSGLEYNSEYTVTVSGKDLAGNSILTIWKFKTSKVGFVNGTVVDEEGAPVEGANVTLYGISQITGVDGTFSFDEMTIGDLTMTVVLSGYETLTVNVMVLAGQTTELGDLELIELKGTVIGTVVDEEDATLLGANVTLDGLHVITGTDGNFSFLNVKVGTHMLTVVLDGYGTRIMNVTVTATTIDLGDLVLTALKGVIEGVVVDEDGDAIAGATVTLNGSSVVTVVDGSFSFSVDAGTYALDVEKDGYHLLTMNATALRNETTDLGELELISSIVTGDIEGALTDEDGNVMANVTVSLSNGMNTTTDAYGRFWFNDVVVGNYTLTVNVDGYGTLTEDIGVEEDGTTVLNDLTLEAEGTDNDGADSSMMLIIVAMLAIIAIAVIVVVFLRRRPMKP